MKTHVIKSILLSAALFWTMDSQKVEAKELTISKIATTIIIDGMDNDSAWDSIPWEEIDQENYHYNPVAGFSAKFKMCYDDTNVYIIVRVNDLTPMQDGTFTWQSDCVQLFFAMDTNSSNTYRPGDWQIRKIASKSLEDGGVEGGSGSDSGMVWDISSLLTNPQFNVQQQDGGEYYIQEWRLPIATLANGASFNGKSFRFDIEAVNDVGTQDKYSSLYWNSNEDDQWFRILHHGYVFFEKPISNNYCQVYSDSLVMYRDTIQQLRLQLNQLQSERNSLADSLQVLYNMVVQNQVITLLSFDEVTTSVALKKGNVNLHIYPNPAHDRMLIECSETISAYSIYNTSGQLISSSTLPAIAQSPYAIQLPALSPGMYYLYLDTSKGMIAVKFQKD